MNWNELKASGAWTPGRIWKLREVMGRVDGGEDARAMGRVRFAELLGTTEMSIYRWESGKRSPMVPFKRILVAEAERRLHPWQLEEVAEYEGPAEYETDSVKQEAAQKWRASRVTT